MNRKLYGFSLILLLLLPLASMAQNSKKIWVEVHSGFTYMGLNQNLLGNWNNGWNIGTGLTYSLDPKIEISTRFSFQRFGYEGNKLDLAVPQFVGPPTLHVSGKSTNMYEIAAAIRLIAPTPYIKPFVSIGGGAYFMDVGRITLQYWLSYANSSDSGSLYDGSGKIYRKAFGLLGVGFEVPVSRTLQLRLEGQYANALNSFGTFVPVTMAVQFAL